MLLVTLATAPRHSTLVHKPLAVDLAIHLRQVLQKILTSKQAELQVSKKEAHDRKKQMILPGISGPSFTVVAAEAVFDEAGGGPSGGEGCSFLT